MTHVLITAQTNQQENDTFKYKHAFRRRKITQRPSLCFDSNYFLEMLNNNLSFREGGSNICKHIMGGFILKKEYGNEFSVQCSQT
jgi:hypothetical protein